MLTQAQKESVAKLNQEWLERGNKLTEYKCPHCQWLIETRQPSSGMVSSRGYWDSTKECLHCGNLNFVKVWPDGRTEATKI